MEEMTARHPLEGQIVLLAGAQASVTLEQLSRLLADAHSYLCRYREYYDRQFEQIEGESTVYYLAGPDHWEQVGTALHLAEREIDAVGRAHEAQFTRDGRRLGRTEEFEAALSIRSPVALE